MRRGRRPRPPARSGTGSRSANSPDPSRSLSLPRATATGHRMASEACRFGLPVALNYLNAAQSISRQQHARRRTRGRRSAPARSGARRRLAPERARRSRRSGSRRRPRRGGRTTRSGGTTNREDDPVRDEQVNLVDVELLLDRPVDAARAPGRPGAARSRIADVEEPRQADAGQAAAGAAMAMARSMPLVLQRLADADELAHAARSPATTLRTARIASGSHMTERRLVGVLGLLAAVGAPEGHEVNAEHVERGEARHHQRHGEDDVVPAVQGGREDLVLREEARQRPDARRSPAWRSGRSGG